MSSVADQNKKITKEFFEALSNGSDEYLDFYTNESIIWTAGNNAIGGTRTKEEVVSFAQNILAAFPTGIKFNITGMTAEGDRVAIVLDGAQHKGMPHRRFQGRTGTIAGKQGRAYVVNFKDGNMKKTVVARPEHLKPIKG